MSRKNEQMKKLIEERARLARQIEELTIELRTIDRAIRLTSGEVPVQEATPQGTVACEYVLNAEGGRMQIHYAWQGGTGAMKITRAAMQFGGKAVFTEVPELGDEALVGPMGNPVMMRKGDVLVTINVLAQGVSPEGGKKVAALVAERMGN